MPARRTRRRRAHSSLSSRARQRGRNSELPVSSLQVRRIETLREEIAMLRTSFFAAALVFAASQANAADMKLLVGGAMQEPFREVGAEFAKRNGHKLDFTVDTTGLLQKRLREGAKADIILLSSPGMDALEKENLITPGTRANLAIAAIGVS